MRAPLGRGRRPSKLKSNCKKFCTQKVFVCKVPIAPIKAGWGGAIVDGCGGMCGTTVGGGGAVECCGMLCGLHFLPCPNKNPLPGTPTPGSPEQSPRHDDLLYQDVCVTPPQCRTRQAQARSPVSYVDAMCDSPRQARARLPSLSRQSKFFI